MHMEAQNKIGNSLQSTTRIQSAISNQKEQSKDNCPDGVCQVDWKPSKVSISDNSETLDFRPISK